MEWRVVAVSKTSGETKLLYACDVRSQAQQFMRFYAEARNIRLARTGYCFFEVDEGGESFSEIRYDGRVIGKLFIVNHGSNDFL